jgi:hypothetical protein
MPPIQVYSDAHIFRNKSDQCRNLANKTRSLRDGSRYRKMAQAYWTLAATEDWLAGKIAPCEQGHTT